MTSGTSRPDGGAAPIPVDYVAPIPRGGISGRSKATTEKSEALRRVSPGSRVFLLGSRLEGRPALQMLGILSLEVRYLLTRIWVRRPPRAIITRSPVPFGAMFVGRLRGIPVIKEIHTDIGNEAPVAFKGRPLMRLGFSILHRADVWSARRASGVIFNHTVLERHFRAAYLRERAITVTVPNGTDPARFRPGDRSECREELGLDPWRRYLVWAGAINPWHGVDRLPGLADALPDDYEILVVGKATSSYARGLVESNTSPRLRFTDAVPPHVAARYISAADAGLLPVSTVRISPGSPLKLFDYAACGAPIVCQHATEGYSDIVLGTGIGIAVDFEDPATAAARIVDAMPGLAALREHVRHVAETQFSWESRMRAWLSFAAGLHAPARPHE